MHSDYGHSVHVGVFWYIKGCIYGERETLNTNEYAIECMVDSQLEHWRVWDTESKIVDVPVFRKDYEYFSFLRGSVLYDVRYSKYIVYCDEVLMTPHIKKKIAIFIGSVNEEIIYKTDLHYSTDGETIRGLFEDGI